MLTSFLQNYEVSGSWQGEGRSPAGRLPLFISPAHTSLASSALSSEWVDLHVGTLAQVRGWVRPRLQVMPYAGAGRGPGQAGPAPMMEVVWRAFPTLLEAPRKNWALESGHQGPSLACGSLNQFLSFLLHRLVVEGERRRPVDRELVRGSWSWCHGIATQPS